MPTLLDDRLFEPMNDALVEEFDLERLARISEMPSVEPPSFALAKPTPRFRLRRTLALAFLASMIVAGLATLGPVAQVSATAPNACSVAH